VQCVSQRVSVHLSPLAVNARKPPFVHSSYAFLTQFKCTLYNGFLTPYLHPCSRNVRRVKAVPCLCSLHVGTRLVKAVASDILNLGTKRKLLEAYEDVMSI
jgi:hypothetical protein